MLTLAGLESSYGKRRLFVRLEPGYAPGGRYYRDSKTVRERWYTYGCLAASSYGAFQIMYVTAEEMGFFGHPIELQKDAVCAYWAGQLISQRICKRFGAKTLTDVLDAYNSGNFKDQIIPKDYVAKGIQLYANLDNV